MSIKKVNFKNSEGLNLAARLELPNNQPAHSYAIFAHCFTCNKNLSAVRNIARALNNKGIAVLRFDFTGLGESEGDFADTNFSSNVDDLVEAAKYLETNYKAPTLLIGHSLGGAAVIYASKKIDSILAIATIGAPSDPSHVQHLFSSNIDEIEKTGIANITIGGRSFSVKKEFLEDIQSKNMHTILKQMKKPLLVVHSPQDNTVGIENAKEIYHHAHHPKSFISIDQADHLLSNKQDSIYVGNVIAGWAERYLPTTITENISTKHQVAVSIGNEGFTSEIRAGKHLLIADEPESIGGKDYGPSPYEYVSSGLGACTVMTLRMYADRKKWNLQKVTVHIDHGKEYATDKDDISAPSKKIDTFVREIELHGNLSDEQRQRLLEIADKCPVHKTLHSDVQIKSSLK